MFALVKDGLVLGLFAKDMPFEVDGVQYPANWWQFTSKDDVVALGFRPAIFAQRPDDAFYVIEQEEPYVDDKGIVRVEYAVTGRPLDELKVRESAAVDATAHAMLSPTDWMITRSVELADKPVPNHILTFRAAVRAESARLKTGIGRAKTIPALIAVVQSQSWPQSS